MLVNMEENAFGTSADTRSKSCLAQLAGESRRFYKSRQWLKTTQTATHTPRAQALLWPTFTKLAKTPESSSMQWIRSCPECH